MKIVAIVPAAGVGRRLKDKIKKPYILLGQKPLLVYSLLILEKVKKISQVILVVDRLQIKLAEKIIKHFKLSKVKKIIAGGKTRTESVRNGLKVVDKETDFILIHDAARPFIIQRFVENCIKEALKFKAVVCAVPCSSTIKEVDKNLNVISTLDRNKLYEVQTPQVFASSIIKNAYANLKIRKSFFDDASLVEQLPQQVKIVPGLATNIKITTPNDLKIARALLKMNK